MPDQRSFAKQWRASPWTIKAYVALTVLTVGYWLIADPELWRVFGSVLLNAFFIYGLVRGSKTVWVILLILDGLGIALSLVQITLGRQMIDEPIGYFFVDVGVRIVMLFVLLHPLTRVWLRTQRAASAERPANLSHAHE